MNLVSVKVSDRYGRARVSDVIAGIEWAVDDAVSWDAVSWDMAVDDGAYLDG